MKILALDTSGLQASVAIVAEAGICDCANLLRENVKNLVACQRCLYITVGEVMLNARTREKSWTHSEILMPGVAQLFKLTRLEPHDIDYVAYTCGPGSFTGLRIGAASALGIARALNKSVIEVPTLDALAYNLIGTGNGGFVVPMLDARRGQVYTAVYLRGADGGIERETEFMALSIEEFFENFLTGHKMQPLENCIFFLGDGADANKAAILETFPNAIFSHANNNRQRAASVGVCAIKKIKQGYELSDKVKLLYVRAPQAIREAEKKNAK